VIWDVATPVFARTASQTATVIDTVTSAAETTRQQRAECRTKNKNAALLQNVAYDLDF